MDAMASKIVGLGEIWVNLLGAFGINDYATALNGPKNFPRYYASVSSKMKATFPHQDFPTWHDRQDLFRSCLTPRDFNFYAGVEYRINASTCMTEVIRYGTIGPEISPDGQPVIDNEFYAKVFPHVVNGNARSFNMDNSLSRVCADPNALKQAIKLLPSTPVTAKTSTVGKTSDMLVDMSVHIPSVPELLSSGRCIFAKYVVPEDFSISIREIIDTSNPANQRGFEQLAADPYNAKPLDLMVSLGDGIPEDENSIEYANLADIMPLVGYTGLVGRIVKTVNNQGRRVGIIAITGGITLGDWMRYNTYFNDTFSQE